MPGRGRVRTRESGAPVEVASGLPLPSTRLVGRDGELRRLQSRLGKERLITLTGPPGSGKTRLAIEVARNAQRSFADGAWFVALAPIENPEDIANAVAQALGLKEDAATPTADLVGRYLANRQVLLVIDNFEHVVEGATLLTQWLAAAERLCCLATSRAALHLTGEHEFEVPPLDVPAHPDDPGAASSAAVQLFNERASAVGPGFEADAQALADVARICQRLDGLPLALELAAARTKALPVAAIRSRLDRSLDLLNRAARDVPERHRSLHAAVSWSYGLLTPAERTFFRRLSVFRGGWSLEAADAVTLAGADLESEALDLTTALLDGSLIRRQPESRAEARYDMLETLREYGRERLAEAGEAEETAERHAQWHLELAERASPLLTTSDRGAWLDRLELEWNNLRVAMRWAIDRRNAELGMRIAAALWRFWQTRAHIGEGRVLLAELLAIEADVQPSIRAQALSAAGSLAYWQNDAAACLPLYQESVAIRRAIGDAGDLAGALYDLGHALSVLSPILDTARGRDLEVEALAIYRSLGSRGGETWLGWALGCNSYFAGDNEQAFVELSASVDQFRDLDDPFGLAWALTMTGLAAVRLGRPEVAETAWHEALRIFGEVDDVTGIDSVLEHLARLAGAAGHTRRAIRLAAAAARIRGVSQSSVIQMFYRTSSGDDLVDVLADARRAGAVSVALVGGGQLSQEDLETARREGEAMTTREAVAYALEPVSGRADSRLRVQALGAMVVERRGTSLQRWGGDKAGSRQAQALFAFLFDRGPAGIAKDEATEMLWPDLSIRRGDLAFHRTLGGLRSVLDEGREGAESINFESGRYRLAPDLVAWSDVQAFEGGVSSAVGLDGPEAIEALEEARQLYRGDLFDDCPFYGDSALVEERRSSLRGLFEDLLIELGERHLDAGNRAEAAASYRSALGVNENSQRAKRGLELLAPRARTRAT